MKNVLTLLVYALFVTTGVAQSDVDLSISNPMLNSPERTPVLNALYEQSRYLETHGTVAEIEANRLAIKSEWQGIDPAIAALYKPVDNGGALPEIEENVGVNGVSIPAIIREREEIPQNRDWIDDRLIRNLWVDGVDMDVTGVGDIYISTYVNYISTGSTRDSIAIYRSIDGGASFDQWKRIAVTATIEKVQLISFDGSGDEYIIAYVLTDTETFQAFRWNVANGNFDAQVIATGVSDFGVDRNYPGTTATQRAFATYQKMTSCTNVHSARSTSGSYGFDWVDEVTTSSTCGLQVEYAYGLNGSGYVTYTGASSGNLYANVNSNYNDPASWGARETLATGASIEVLNPKIAAARKALASDEVIILCNSRTSGSTNPFNHTSYRRENQAAYALLFDGIPLPNNSIGEVDTWIRKNNGTEVIRTSYLLDIVDNSTSDACRSYTYDGSNLVDNELVSDPSTDVWEDFPAAIAETNDDMPCMAFSGTSAGGTFGFGLYFDSKAGILNTQSNTIEELTYFPNPVLDKVNVSGVKVINSITIYNLLGHVVQYVKPNSERASIDMTTSSKGVYIMEVESEGERGSYKLIKQ
tara:strand:+ start:17042 stop:18793 length:1752 start_codon:yes stop_codon:yes gene_type:complete